MSIATAGLQPTAGRSSRSLSQHSATSPLVVGTLLGLAAATVGVVPLIPGIPIRPCYVFLLAAVVITYARPRQTRPGSSIRRATSLGIELLLVILPLAEIIT